MVMIGVPNLGAELADLLKQNFLFKTFYGPAGQQLGGLHDVLCRMSEDRTGRAFLGELHCEVRPDLFPGDADG